VPPKTGDLFEWTINTSKGPVDMLAEMAVEGDTIHLKDVAVFPRSGEPLTGLSQEILAARTELVNDARQMGFKHLRITGHRVPTGSSANPGKTIDLTIELTMR
jgi:hypothetical protein